MNWFCSFCSTYVFANLFFIHDLLSFGSLESARISLLLPVYLFIYVFIYLSVYLSIYLSIYLSFYLFIYVFIYLFIYLFIIYIIFLEGVRIVSNSCILHLELTIKNNNEPKIYRWFYSALWIVVFDFINYRFAISIWDRD